MELIIVAIIGLLILTIVLQSKRIKGYRNGVEDLQASLRARLGHQKFEYKGLSSNDALIQELEEIIENVDDIFDEV
jgi:hypothetical protein